MAHVIKFLFAPRPISTIRPGPAPPLVPPARSCKRPPPRRAARVEAAALRVAPRACAHRGPDTSRYRGRRGAGEASLPRRPRPPLLGADSDGPSVPAAEYAAQFLAANERRFVAVPADPRRRSDARPASIPRYSHSRAAPPGLSNGASAAAVGAPAAADGIHVGGIDLRAGPAAGAEEHGAGWTPRRQSGDGSEDGSTSGTGGTDGMAAVRGGGESGGEESGQDGGGWGVTGNGRPRRGPKGHYVV